MKTRSNKITIVFHEIQSNERPEHLQNRVTRFKIIGNNKHLNRIICFMQRTFTFCPAFLFANCFQATFQNLNWISLTYVTLDRVCVCVYHRCIYTYIHSLFFMYFPAQEPVHTTTGLDNYGNQAFEPLDRGPYFDVSASRNVTALVGSVATLNCRVRNLGDRTVCITQRDIKLFSPKKS